MDALEPTMLVITIQRNHEGLGLLHWETRGIFTDEIWSLAGQPRLTLAAAIGHLTDLATAHWIAQEPFCAPEVLDPT